jgi:hypothetical protein
MPPVSSEPLRFLEGLPWLVMAAAMRVVAFGGGPIAIPAVIVATIAVLHAYLVVAQRSMEITDGQSSLGDLDFWEKARLTLAILWRIALLMLAATVLLWMAGYPSFASGMLLGIDGMAFDQFTDIGKFWSAIVAALTLLMIVGAERNRGQINLFGAAGDFARRGLWFGAAVVALGLVYLGLGLGQGLVRGAIWHFWQTSSASQFIKNLTYFVFIFSFAMLRLWVTLLVLTYGLKQSYVGAGNSPGASSGKP